jgi:23S rRNA (adenine2503-C2)-methyltransferase
MDATHASSVSHLGLRGSVSPAGLGSRRLHTGISATSGRHRDIIRSVSVSILNIVNPHRRIGLHASISGGGVLGVSTVDEDRASGLAAGLQYPVDDDGKVIVKNLAFLELVSFCREVLGEERPEKRAKQLWRWMYSDYTWIRGLEDAAVDAGVQNGFSRGFIERFNSVATLNGGLVLVDEHTARDGTVKLVFEVTTGAGKGGKIETVLIPVMRGNGERGTKERITLCVSSQLGCAMGCKFCWTGKLGLLGNLSTAQIVEQVVAARRYHYETYGGSANQGKSRYVTPITNIVYMGMGEPLDNLEAVVGSIDIVLDHAGLHFSHNKVTVSTVGLVPEMRRLLSSTNVALAVSLHGATNEVRGSIVPINNRYSVEELISALEELFPLRKKSAPHVLIEYTMMNGVNDRVEDARALLTALQHVKCKVNLIVFNPHEGTPYTASTSESVSVFRDILIQGGRVVTVRASRGDDEAAACGQLGGKAEDAKMLKRNKLQV